MTTLSTLRDVNAGRILPGDTILSHPDNPDQQGRWTITHVRHVGPHFAHVRLDYTSGDAIGCFVVPYAARLTAVTGGVGTWLDALTDDEARFMLTFLTGYARDAVEHALAQVQQKRDRQAYRAERSAEEAIAS